MDEARLATSASRAPRLLVADDHLVVAEGIERLLAEHYESVGLVCSGEALIESVKRGDADVVIADISMDGINGIDAMRSLRAQGDTVPFVFLTMHGESSVAAEAIRAGGNAYVLKSSAGEELVRAIQEVLSGRIFITPAIAAHIIVAEEHQHYSLTDKQMRILTLVAQGLRSKQIAYELGVSVRTVESHKYAIMQEMGVHGTVELIRKAEQVGLI